MNSKTNDERINRFEKVGNILHQRIDFINIAKIIIVSFTAFYLLGNFIPFYEGNDASIFAFTSINLLDGSYSITNELLKVTGSWDFIPVHWTKTIYNTAVPDINPGFPLLGTIAYLFGGIYGLFYLVPSITIIFLILMDRIATNLFGRRVGLLTLLFLSSNFWILSFGIQFMSDIPFTLVLMGGCFYFLKYLHQPTEKYLLLASSLFTFAAFMRLNGIIFFLVEILILFSFFTYEFFLKNKSQTKKFVPQDLGISSMKLHRTFKIVISIIGPWSLFFIFFFSYNNYFFGNPLTLQLFVNESTDVYEPTDVLSFIYINPENIVGYLRAVLPFPLSHDIDHLIAGFDDFFGKYWIGFLTPLLLFSIFLMSYKKDFKKLEIAVFTIFLLSIIIFYSLLPSAESQLDRNISQRYSIPSFSLFSIILGFMIFEIFISDSTFLGIKQEIFLKIFKILMLIFLFAFFSVAFYYAPLIQAILDGTFTLNNPTDLAVKYPLDSEGLKSNSVLLDSKGYLTEYLGIIPLRSVNENFNPETFDVSPTSQQLITKVKHLMNNGYEVFVFKEPSREIDKLFFQYIVQNHDLVLKEYSNSFCKFYLLENAANITKSDEACI